MDYIYKHTFRNTGLKPADHGEDDYHLLVTYKMSNGYPQEIPFTPGIGVIRGYIAELQMKHLSMMLTGYRWSFYREAELIQTGFFAETSVCQIKMPLNDGKMYSVELFEPLM